MKKFVLIDGNAIAHRAFHALPPLSSPDGTVTNAVYGFFSMVLKIVQDIRPEYLIVCFDRPAPTFRKQLYAGYQATRPTMADDLGPQFKILHELLDEAKIKIFELDGFEADDLIGTLSEQANKEHVETIIVTGDRDMLQLVDKDTWVLAPVVGVTKTILYDAQKVKEKYGLTPAEFVDYKALVGDNSDNYPGVSGIGPKTAANLINKYGSLEGIYQNLGEINPKLAEKLATDAEQAALAKKLAKIITDVPITLHFEEVEVGKMDKKALFKGFEKYGFRSLIARFSGFDKIPEAKIEEKKEKEKSDQLDLL